MKEKSRHRASMIGMPKRENREKDAGEGEKPA